jgi:hypothetical protein
MNTVTVYDLTSNKPNDIKYQAKNMIAYSFHPNNLRILSVKFVDRDETVMLDNGWLVVESVTPTH